MTPFVRAVSLLAQATNGGNGGLDPSYIAASATVAAAAIAALVAVMVYVLGQRAARRDRKRELCGKAIAEVLAWLELPYRIRRRVDDAPDTLRGLVDRMHELQESLLFYRGWLQVELPQAHEEYVSLVAAVKAAASSAIQEAWQSLPSSEAKEMNIGEFQIDRTAVEAHLTRLTAIVRERFG